MTENQSLFSLAIEPQTKTHLAETARWAKFLAIVALIFLILMTVFGIYASTTLTRYEEGYGNTSLMQSLGVGMAVMYIIIAVIAFFPILFMLRFANNMKRALASNDQQLLNISFQNLKIYFRYLGIVTIISLVLMGLTMVLGILSTATSM